MFSTWIVSRDETLLLPLSPHPANLVLIGRTRNRLHRDLPFLAQYVSWRDPSHFQAENR